MGKVAAYVILVLTLLLIYGSAVLSLTAGIEYTFNETMLFFSLAFNVFIMVGASMAFIYLYYGGDVFERLYFRKEGTARSLIYGTFAAMAFLLATSAVLLLTGYEEENPLAEQIGKQLSVISLILIPLLSAVSEEVFFRGLLHMQMEERIGFTPAVLASSALFALAHLEYGTFLQVVMPFLFGLVLGFLMHRCKNTWAPIAAHFSYNFIGLLALYMSG